MCLRKLRRGHKMIVYIIFIEFHYGLGILKFDDHTFWRNSKFNFHRADKIKKGLRGEKLTFE